jgi:cell division protein FtsI/penicillin-binding protein 2
VVVSGALNEHTVELTDRFDCERGAFHFAGRTLHDHESFGVLSVEEIITHSSNIGAAKIGMKRGEDVLFEYIQRFGFGQLTGIDLPGEISASRYVQRSKWTKVSIAQVPMGQGISVTRLQTAMAMAAVANHGVLMRPMIIDRLEDNQHRVVSKYYPQVVRRVMDEAAVKKMVTALKTVPTKEGTAPKAAMEHYKVAGKTGTAQKVVEKRGYVHGKYISSFVGFFPADNPELCISIVLDEPRKHGYYGGQVAAPLFRKVAERAATYLGIPPDEAEEAGKVAEGGGPTNDTRFAHAGGTLARQSLKP